MSAVPVSPNELSAADSSAGRRLASAPWQLAAVALLAAAALAVPLVLSDYRIFLVTMTLITAIAVLGLNMLVGYNGQLSLGHGAIYALGAYVSAILIEHGGMPWWATLPVSAAVCFMFGFGFGWPALRLRGHYLALATFALALATPQLLKHKAFEAWTGGVQGITLSKPDAPFGWTLSQDQWLYLVVLAIAALMFATAWNLLRGRLGRATIAIREQPIAAAAMGVDVARTKAMIFGISSLYTGVAGSLGAIATAFVAPDSFGMFVSVFFLVGVVVGGLGTISGAFVGAAFIQFIPNVAGQISKSAPSAIFAGFLILCMFVMPQGFVGLLRAARRRLKRQARPSERPRGGD